MWYSITKNEECDKLEKNIVEMVKQYEQMAHMLEQFKIEECFDDTIPEYIQTALLRLYYAKALEQKLNQCETFLNEDTDEETVNYVTDAAQAIDDVTDNAFSEVDEYAAHEPKFAGMMELVSVSSGEGSLADNLYKLFKCEGIIRMAYKCAMKFPLYGIQESSIQQLDMNNDMATAPEDMIMRKMGIEIYELIEIRKSLIEDIGQVLGGKLL